MSVSLLTSSHYNRTGKNQPAAVCRHGGRTDSQAGRRHQTSGRRGSSEEPPSVKTHLFHKRTKAEHSLQQNANSHAAKDSSSTRPETQGRLTCTEKVQPHLLFLAAGFSFQHLQQAFGSQPPGRVHKHHALFQMMGDVHGGSKTHLRRPVKVDGRLLAAD